jgi:hypothetical protein
MTRAATATRGGAARRYREFDCVKLRRDLPEYGLRRGEEGTIVHAFETADTYLVEFVNSEDGSTRAELEVTPDDIAQASTRRAAPSQ